jgi:hypothetical protein
MDVLIADTSAVVDIYMVNAANPSTVAFAITNVASAVNFACTSFPTSGLYGGELTRSTADVMSTKAIDDPVACYWFRAQFLAISPGIIRITCAAGGIQGVVVYSAPTASPPEPGAAFSGPLSFPPMILTTSDGTVVTVTENGVSTEWTWTFVNTALATAAFLNNLTATATVASKSGQYGQTTLTVSSFDYNISFSAVLYCTKFVEIDDPSPITYTFPKPLPPSGFMTANGIGQSTRYSQRIAFSVVTTNGITTMSISAPSTNIMNMTDVETIGIVTDPLEPPTVVKTYPLQPNYTAVIAIPDVSFLTFQIQAANT